MPTIIATHEVEDATRWLAAWKKGAGSRHDTFRAHGAPQVRVFQDPENPKVTGLLIEVEDMKAFQEFMQSSEVERAKAADGVKSETLKLLAEVNT